MARSTYHHGNLREELVGAAVRRSRSEGAEALVVRELARDVDVTPAAVYRHFPDLEHLRSAVSQIAREQLAESMIAARDSATGGRTRAKRAIQRFSAVGAAYVQFAADEPGLFDVAFTNCAVEPGQPDEPSAWDVLQESLDELVEVGAMPVERLDDAPMIAWTSVHGLAVIIAGGGLPAGMTVEDATAMVIAGVHRALGVGRSS